jgi:hypothetical protein
VNKWVNSKTHKKESEGIEERKNKKGKNVA